MNEATEDGLMQELGQESQPSDIAKMKIPVLTLEEMLGSAYFLLNKLVDFSARCLCDEELPERELPGIEYLVTCCYKPTFQSNFPLPWETGTKAAIEKAAKEKSPLQFHYSMFRVWESAGACCREMSQQMPPTSPGPVLSEAAGANSLGALVYFFYGKSFYLLGKYELAIRNFTGLLERLKDAGPTSVGPGFPGLMRPTYICLGDAYFKNGETKKAEEAYFSLSPPLGEPPSGPNTLISLPIKSCDNLNNIFLKDGRYDKIFVPQSSPFLELPHYAREDMAEAYCPTVWEKIREYSA